MLVPSCSDVKAADILQARIENNLIGSLGISEETVNGRQSLLKKRDRISQDHELNKESLEKSYQLEVSIVQLHLTGLMRVDRLEKLRREHANRLKELELAHSTDKNSIRHDTESFTKKVAEHSFEGNAHHDSFDAIDNVRGQSTDAHGRKYLHKVKNKGSVVSQTRSATQAQGSKSCRRLDSSHPEENNKASNSRSSSRSAERASETVMELGGGATSARIIQGGVLPGKTLLEKIDLDKKMPEEAEKDTFHQLSPSVSSGKGAEDMTSRDGPTSGGSDIKVVSDHAIKAASDKEIPSSEMAPHEEAGVFPSVEVHQSSDFIKTSVDDCGVLGIHSMAVCATEDQNHYESEVLVSLKPSRATTGNVSFEVLLSQKSTSTITGNVSPSHCQEGIVSVNPTYDAYGDPQIRDVHLEVTCRSEFPSSSAPGSPPMLPPLSTDKDEIRQDRSLHNNLQEAEREGPNSMNCASDCGVAQIQPVVQSQIYEDVFPSSGPQHKPLADALISPLQVETLTHEAPNSHRTATRTSSQPRERAAAHSLGTGGAHFGSSPLPSTIPPQPLVHEVVERPFPDPLDNELEKLNKAVEHNDQTHADLNLRLKSECDREIQDMVAQIHAKYDLMQKEAYAAYKLKKNDFSSYMNKVYLHKKLTEAYEMVASGSHLQQGVPANAPQQSFHVLSSAGGSQIPSLGASPMSLPPNISPTGANTLICPRSTHPLVINSQSSTPALLYANSTSSHYSNAALRPLLNSTTPARNMIAPTSTAPPMANRMVTMERTCAPVPRLQHFRPQAGPILQEAHLSGNFTNRPTTSLSGNVSSYPTSHIPNQVLPPPEAGRPWAMDNFPGSSGYADFILLSDEDDD